MTYKSADFIRAGRDMGPRGPGGTAAASPAPSPAISAVRMRSLTDKNGLPAGRAGGVTGAESRNERSAHAQPD